MRTRLGTVSKICEYFRSNVTERFETDGSGQSASGDLISPLPGARYLARRHALRTGQHHRHSGRDTGLICSLLRAARQAHAMAINEIVIATTTPVANCETARRDRVTAGLTIPVDCCSPHRLRRPARPDSVRPSVGLCRDALRRERLTRLVTLHDRRLSGFTARRDSFPGFEADHRRHHRYPVTARHDHSVWTAHLCRGARRNQAGGATGDAAARRLSSMVKQLRIAISSPRQPPGNPAGVIRQAARCRAGIGLPDNALPEVLTRPGAGKNRRVRGG